MLKAPGVGLAANQIGILKKIVTIFFVDQETKKETQYNLFNPNIIYYSNEKVIMEEGCLSIPEQFADIERSQKIIVEYLNDKNKLVRFGKELAPVITSGPPGITGFSGGRPRPQEIIAFWPCLIEKKYIKTFIGMTPMNKKNRFIFKFYKFKRLVLISELIILIFPSLLEATVIAPGHIFLSLSL